MRKQNQQKRSHHDDADGDRRQLKIRDRILIIFYKIQIFAEDSISENFRADSSFESKFDYGASKADTPKRMSYSALNLIRVIQDTGIVKAEDKHLVIDKDKAQWQKKNPLKQDS